MSYAAVVNGGSPIGNNFDRSLTGGFLAHVLFTPILTFVLTPESKGGAVCGSSARTDLCGGRVAMLVPTATLSADSGPDHTVAGDEQPLSPVLKMGWRDRDKSREREGVRPRRLDGLVD